MGERFGKNIPLTEKVITPSDIFDCDLLEIINKFENACTEVEQECMITGLIKKVLETEKLLIFVSYLSL